MKQSLGQCHHLRHIQVVFSRAAIFRGLAWKPCSDPFFHINRPPDLHFSASHKLKTVQAYVDTVKETEEA